MEIHDFEWIFEVFALKTYDNQAISPQLSARDFPRRRGTIIQGPEGFLPDFWVRNPQKSMILTNSDLNWSESWISEGF